MTSNSYSLDDGVCPHCGADDISHHPAVGEWSCRQCGGGKYDTPPRVLDLIEQGLTPAEAVDWIAVVKAGRTQIEWADTRERDQSTISENKDKAGAKLDQIR
jgi:hypothetical protein